MKTSWKKLLTVVSTALLCGALLTGCGGSGGSGGSDGSGGGMLGSKSLGPDAPKEVVAQLKFGDKDVPLYEYTGAELPKFISGTTLAVTKDAIYGIGYGADKKAHLQKFALKDGAITGVEDLGTAEDMPVSSDGTNIYYILDGKGTVGCYDGKAATSFTAASGVEVSRVYAIYGGKDAYISGQFASRDVLFGAISKEGMKDPKVVLPKDEFGKLSQAKDVTKESNASLVCADKDGFYISTLATNGGGSDKWTFPLHMYGPDGKKIRTFDCNADLPSGAEKRKAGERQAIATKDYVVFFYSGYLRLFNKKDGKYVGDIELMLEKHKIDPRGVTADDANHIYFTDAGGDQPMIYRIDL